MVEDGHGLTVLLPCQYTYHHVICIFMHFKRIYCMIPLLHVVYN